MIASAPNPHEIHLNLFCQESPVAPFRRQEAFVEAPDPVPPAAAIPVPPAAAIMDIDRPELRPRSSGKKRPRKGPDSEETMEPGPMPAEANPEAAGQTAAVPTSRPEAAMPAEANPEPAGPEAAVPTSNPEAAGPDRTAAAVPTSGPTAPCEATAEEAAQDKGLDNQVDKDLDNQVDKDLDNDVEITSYKITKKTKKRNKGLKRAAWIESKIAEMKQQGRWYGSSKPNPTDRKRRLEAEKAEEKK